MKEQMIEFLLKAKQSTYAANGQEAPASRPLSHDYHYEANGYKYIDTYLGGMKFSGEEALWVEGKPYWTMNYCGRVLADGFDGDFLKEALRHVPVEKPYRGPDAFEKDGFRYICEVTGTFEWYQGSESIYKFGEKVYECVFHGGLVQD